MKQVADKNNVKLIDLGSKSENLYMSLGAAKAKNLFMIFPSGKYLNYPDGKYDTTHFQDYGASQMARLVTDGIKEVKLPISKYINRILDSGK